MKTHVRTEWSDAILVCKKCSKKLRGGFGDKGRDGLAKALRKACNGGKRRKDAVGIIEVGCLGICPRGAVTVVRGSHPDDWLLVRSGTPLREVMSELGLAASTDE